MNCDLKSQIGCVGQVLQVIEHISPQGKKGEN